VNARVKRFFALKINGKTTPHAANYLARPCKWNSAPWPMTSPVSSFSLKKAREVKGKRKIGFDIETQSQLDNPIISVNTL
jgi:hypothetical protein